MNVLILTYLADISGKVWCFQVKAAHQPAHVLADFGEYPSQGDAIAQATRWAESNGHAVTDKPLPYFETSTAIAKSMVGKRVEIPVHYDAWARGARYGVVSSVAADGDFIRIKMDHPQIKRRVKVWRLDFNHVKLI